MRVTAKFLVTLSLLGLMVLSGCGGDSTTEPGPDAAADASADATVDDATLPADAGNGDAATLTDAGELDSGPLDAMTDQGATDVGAADLGMGGAGGMGGEGGSGGAGGMGGVGGAAGMGGEGGMGGAGGAAGMGGEGGLGGAGGMGGAGGLGGAGGMGGQELGPNLMEVARERQDLSQFVAAVEAAGLDTILDGPARYTVFAPNDEAFDAVPQLQALLGDPVALSALLNYHIHSGAMDLDSIRSRRQIDTRSGRAVSVSLMDDSTLINGNALVETDIEGSNGFIHVLAGVLDSADAPRPENLLQVLRSDARFSTFADLIDDTGFDADLSEVGPFTVFAPTNDAFDALEAAQPGFLVGLGQIAREAFVMTHLVEGRLAAAEIANLRNVLNFNNVSLPFEASPEGQRVADQLVIEADIDGGNGLVHALDGVILRERDATIHELLDADGRFTTFLQAVEVSQQTALLDEVNWQELLTVFAPTDDAFQAVEVETPGTLEAVLGNPEWALELVLHHVFTGEYDAEDLGQLDFLAARSGRLMPIQLAGNGSVVIGSSTVAEPDLYAHNGLVHVVGAVIRPPEAQEPPDCLEPGPIAVGDLVAGTTVLAPGFYEFSAPADGAYCVSTLGSAYNTRISARTDCADEATLVGSNDDVMPGVLAQSQLTIEATAGQSYFVVVDGPDDASGDFVLSVSDGACQSPLSIIDILEGLGGFDSFLIALDILDDYDRFAAPDANLTVFAATEAAWDRLDALEDGASEALLGDDDRLRLVIQHHTLPNPHTLAELITRETWETENGQSVAADQIRENVEIDGVLVQRGDLTANNGIVHTVNRMFSPRTPCVADAECEGDQVCVDDFCQMPPPVENIITELENAGEFQRLLAYLARVGLTEDLRHGGPFTLFAPTDAVFAEIEAEDPVAFNALLDDLDGLRALLLYHVVTSDVSSHQLYALDRIVSATGMPIEIDAGPAGITLNGVAATAVDRAAENGRIHTVAGVLEQPTVLSPGRCEAPQQLPGFGRFLGVTQGEIGSMDTLCSEHCGPVNSPESVFSYVAEEDGTVCFLTRDSAYDTVLHIRSDCDDGTSELVCNDDSAFAGGVHSAVELDVVAGAEYFVMVDGCSRRNRVVGEEGHFLLTVRQGPCRQPTTIMDRLEQQTAKYRTLLHALRVAGVDELLQREEPRTLIAPTEVAFNALEDANPGSLAELTSNPAALRDLLLYHIIDGSNPSERLIEQENVATLDGRFVQFYNRGRSIFANRLLLESSDIAADNGFIHSLDDILTPPTACPAGPVDCGEEEICDEGQCMLEPYDGTIVDELRAMGTFTTFLQFAEMIDLLDVIANANLTLFVPNDQAFSDFESFDQAGYNDVLTNPAEMLDLIQYHMVTEIYTQAELGALESVITNQGSPLTLQERDDGIRVNGHRPIDSDILAYNGIIHVIDRVMRPPAEPDACEEPIEILEFGEFQGDTSLGGARYGSTCGGLAESREIAFLYTAPDDRRICVSTAGSDFDTVVHVRRGVCEELEAQANCPDAADLTCCNDDSDHAGDFASALTLNTQAGEDYFIFVDGFGAESEGQFNLRVSDGACGEQAPENNILEVLENQGGFEILLDALSSAQLSRTLTNEDEIHTLFAPTDAAFAALDAQLQAVPDGDPENLEDLLRTRAVLVPMLSYHLLPGSYFSDRLAESNLLMSVEGRPVMLDVRGEDIYVSDQRLIETNLPATNGVVHIIDTVLEPPEVCVRDEDCGDGQVCDLATGYCRQAPEPGTCRAPFLIEQLGEIQGSTAEPADGIGPRNFEFGTCGGRSGFEHVYQFEPALGPGQEQEFCFHTIGSAFDTVLYSRRNVCTDRSAERHCNDDNRAITGVFGASAMTVRAIAGETVYVFIDGWSDLERGDYTLTVSLGSCEGGGR